MFYTMPALWVFLFVFFYETASYILHECGVHKYGHSQNGQRSHCDQRGRVASRLFLFFDRHRWLLGCSRVTRSSCGRRCRGAGRSGAWLRWCWRTDFSLAGSTVISRLIRIKAYLEASLTQGSMQLVEGD